MRVSVVFNFVLAAVMVPSAWGQRPNLIVSPDGKGDVRTIQEAIEKIPVNNRSRFTILIRPGIYKEQIRVPADKPFVSLIGESADKTVLTFSISNKEAGSTSAAFATYVGSHDFRAENITFENSFGQGSQAVAVLVDADRAIFEKCRFLGWQDTLYAKTGRQYYRDCYIEGHVDYIFGQASAVFDHCEIHSKADGYITAPMRFSADEPSGFVFVDSRVTAEGAKNGIYLGRPWRDYGRTVFVNTQLPAEIRPEGWHHWIPEREQTAFMGEYASTGKGAASASRVKWARQLTADEAKLFSPEVFLKGHDGWNPKAADDKWLEKNPPSIRTVTWTEALKQPAAWYQTDEAARIADQVLLYQKNNGGWEKNVDMAAMLTEQEKKTLAAKKSDISETTIDNRTTFTQVNYLAKVITASMLKSTPPTNFPKYKEAFNKGLDHLLSYQYDNGGFPQYFPLKKGYYTHITFNDDAMIGVLRVLRDIARQTADYKFVDDDRRSRAEKAVAKAIPLILKLQVVIDGKKTAWVQQYDGVTLKPAWARKFEPPCLTSSESVGIVRFLMDEKPTPEIVDAIESAITWFKKVELHGIKWVRVNGENTVVKDDKAPPIWARFYEFETMKPIFIGRDSVIKYDVSQIEVERRNGYSWYGDYARSLLGSEYPKWKAKLGKAAN